MPGAPDTGLAWEAITFRYTDTSPAPTFDAFTLRLRPGGIHVLTGPSGCGKSTLLFLAAGLYPEHGGLLDHGTVTLDGRPLTDLAPRERAARIRVVFQNADLQFCMQTVAQELTFVLENIGTPPDRMD